MAVRDRLREVAVGTTAGVAAAYAHEMWRRRAETEMLDGKPTRLEKMDPATITTDPETFQFKSGGDKHGVTDRLKGVKKWDAVAAGKAMVFEKLDGTRVIADGHQRHGLAKRLGAEGQHVRMDGYVMREADGWTPRDVRAYAALKNMQESSGLSLDMAKVMRERPDLVSADRLPMSDAKVREARALSNLSDQAFRMVVGGAVKPEHAAAVGDQVKDQARHADMLAEMQKAKVDSAQHARLYVQQAMAAPSITQSQSSLFGEETSTRSLLAERAKVLDRALSALKTDKRIFGLLEREASNIEAAGNKLAHASNVDRANNAGQLASLVEKLSTTRGTVSTMLDRAAAAVANGDAPSKAARSFVKSVGDAMKQGGIGALTGEAPGHMQEHLHPIYRPKEKGTTPEAAEKWGKILDELPVSEKQKARVDRAKQEGQNKLPSRMKRMEDDLFGGPSAKDQIAAKARAQEAKGRTGDPMNEGLFGSGMKQTDLVEMAKQPAAAENTYKMKHRPPSSSTLPDGLKWDYAELPRDFAGNRPDLKTSQHQFGVIKTDRPLTASEMRAFEMEPVGKGPSGWSDSAREASAEARKAEPRGMDGLTRSERSGKTAAPKVPVIAGNAAEGAPMMERFRSAYEATLAEQVKANPGKYAYGIDKVPQMAQRMTEALAKGQGDTQSPTVKAVTKALGIKPTVDGIKAALNDQPAPTPRPQKSPLEKAEAAHAKAEADRTRAWKNMQAGRISGAQWADISRKAGEAKKAVEALKAAPAQTAPKFDKKDTFDADFKAEKVVPAAKSSPVSEAERAGRINRLTNRAAAGGLSGEAADRYVKENLAKLEALDAKRAGKATDVPTVAPAEKFKGTPIPPAPKSETSAERNARIAANMPRATTHEDLRKPLLKDKNVKALLKEGVVTKADVKGSRTQRDLMDLVAKTRASRDADRGLPAQGSGLRGTQNKANQEAIIKNRKVNAKPASPRAVAAATFKAELGHEPPKNWPVGKINGTIGNLRGLYGADAKTVYAGSVKGASPEVRAAADAAHMASVKNGGPVKPAAPRVVIDPMKLGQARLDTAKAQAAVAKATGSKSFAAAGLHNAAEADKRWNKVEAAAKSAGVKDIGEQMKDVLGTGQPSAEKPATTGKGTGRGTGKKALGLLAPVAIGAAALVAANRSAEAGESKGKQAAAAGAEVGNGAGMFAAFAGGTAIAVKGLMKAGVTAAKAIPGVNLAMVAGGAVHGAATAEKGERLSGAAKGAWDMSLPGMAWNTGAVFKDAAVSTFARATGPVRLSADQQTAYARASERQQAMKQAATSPDSSKKHGWSNAARIAAYKKRQQNAGANPANVPYGGNPANGPAQWAPSQSQTDVAAAMKRR